MATDRVSSARDLSEVVGRDAGLTSRVLQIANSPAFNLQHREVKTVSAAVVMLGFDAVRELALSLSVIDAVQRGQSHVRVARCMSQAFHAAVQAKSFCDLIAPKQSEEVFVAALLKQIGDMAFWSSQGDAQLELDNRLSAAPAKEHAAIEQQVLGFKLQSLSGVLADEWLLGDLVKKAIREKPGLQPDDDPLVTCVQGGHAIAHALLDQGWNGAEAQELVGRIAHCLDAPNERIRELAQASAEQVEKIAEHFGVASLIETVQAEEVQMPAAVNDQADAAATQLQALDAIAEGLELGNSRDELMRLLVEGASASLAGGLCCFYLLTPDRTQLLVKYTSGDDTCLGVCSSAHHASVRAALESTKLLPVSHGLPDPYPVEAGGLLKSVRISGKVVGVLIGQTDSDAANVAGFRQFAQQIPLVLMA